MAFASLEPFGFRSNLYGHAMTSAVLVNTRLNRKPGSKIAYPEDFLPNEEQPKEPKNFVESLKDYFKSAIGKKKTE